MNRVTHAAGRKVFSRIVDHELSQISKNREQAYEKILDTAQKYMDEFDLGINWEYLRRVTLNQGYTLNTYINSMADQLHPNVLKTTLLNLGYEAFYNGTRTIREMRKIHNCNIPWIILMDPTSACNLHCTGCWAAEYGNKLNLTFDEMDSVITQGKELGIYFYMLTGGEPLVRIQARILKVLQAMSLFRCWWKKVAGILCISTICRLETRLHRNCFPQWSREHICTTESGKSAIWNMGRDFLPWTSRMTVSL